MYIQEIKHPEDHSKDRVLIISNDKFTALTVQIAFLIQGGEKIEMERVFQDNESKIEMLHVVRHGKRGTTETYFTRTAEGELELEQRLDSIYKRIETCESLALLWGGEEITDFQKYELERRRKEKDILINGYWAIYNNFQAEANSNYIKNLYGNMKYKI